MVSLALLAACCLTAGSEVLLMAAALLQKVICSLDHCKTVCVMNCSMGDKSSWLGQEMSEGHGLLLQWFCH